MPTIDVATVSAKIGRKYKERYLLSVDDLSTKLSVGDVVCLSGISRINRINGEVVKQPAQFVVTQVAKEGDGEICVYPGFYPPTNKYPTVSRMPKVGDKVQLVKA